jgi:hypothetical protein
MNGGQRPESLFRRPPAELATYWDNHEALLSAERVISVYVMLVVTQHPAPAARTAGRYPVKAAATPGPGGLTQ